jgi:hypothetical protein
MRKQKHSLVIVANAGRSGSTYLWNLLKANSAAPTILHEDIPVQISRPREFNRAYDASFISRILSDEKLSIYIRRWERLLDTGDVIETGWTCYHLLPVFYHVFGDRLKLVILHRDPWSVALSRANMGNYHVYTWYDDRHEVSPHDRGNIATEYRNLWHKMNHAEKCLFWWYVVYKEIDEFLERNRSVTQLTISACALFRGEVMPALSDFLSTPLIVTPTIETNFVSKFMLETFPIVDEYTKFSRHEQINSYASMRFEYSFDPAAIETNAKKYALPPGLMPHLRNSTNYWSHKRRAGILLRSLIGR